MSNWIARRLDSILVSWVTVRLAHFRRAGDTADRFADDLMDLLRGEIERRKLFHQGWEAKVKVAETTMAKQRIEMVAREQFENLDSGLHAKN